MKVTHKTLTRIIREEIEKITTRPVPISYSDDVGREILWKVLADEGNSKDWNDLISLDGGTVGIAHFAGRGMGELYSAMGDSTVESHFSPFNPEITSVEKIKNATNVGAGSDSRDGWCRKGKRNAAPGTCWYMPWWRDGMKSFLESPESKDIQFRAWFNITVLPANELIDQYKSKDPDWESMRGRAIAYSLVNSGGPKLLQKFSKGGSRSPNDTMDAYNIDKGRVRTRMRNLNRLYPDPSFKPSFGAEKFEV